MKVGIVAEGPADVAVIRNILKGKLRVERKDTTPIRPELAEDETDLAVKAASGFRARSPKQFSNWSIVLEECQERTSIEDFLENQIDDDRLVVVHLDTAEAHCEGYDVDRPDRKASDYCDRLRALVAQKLDNLLGTALVDRVRYAIAVEETDAWVLTLHADEGERETGLRLNPKKRLEFVMKEREGKAHPKSKDRGQKPRGGDKRARRSAHDEYHELTLAFRDEAKLAACANRNRSLRLFVDSL